jgi:NAD(P)-dependent dehydrogenase (short-subunit alcohol dehydrogenase family)
VQRLASVDDMADMVAFLVSDQWRYGTGLTVYVDGG